jgi:macrolide transport system ATP-binding/permease protein
MASSPFRRLFRIRAEGPRRIENDMRDEIASHVRLAADQLIAAGLAPAEAEARARARFGDIDAALPGLYESATRRESEIRAREWFGELRRDFVFALRQLRRSPGFAAGVILCLGFGIGSSATVFSWMEGLILRPLPAVPDAERLVTIRADNGQINERSQSTRQRALFISLPEYRDWVAQAGSVSGLAASSLFMFGVQPNPEASDGRAEPVYGMFASANYFDVVGVRPMLGRPFTADEAAAGAPPVALISNKLWLTRFGGSRDALGRRILINGYPTTVVGVAPPGFGGTLAGVIFDVWVPLMSRPLLVPRREILESRDFRWLDVVGRLNDGATMEAAGAEFTLIAGRLAATHPENRNHTINVEPLDTGVAGQLAPLFSILIALTVLVIVIVCSNVANLLLVRSAARSREIGVRISLGASRGRVVQQLMTENLLLAVAGASLGVFGAYYGRGLLGRMMPQTSLPLVLDGHIDVRVLGFVMAITSFAVLLFGLAPALRATRVDLAETLKNGGRGSRMTRSRMRSGLVVAQFALSLTALVFAAIFLRRSGDLQRMDRGFRDPERVLLVQTDMVFAGMRDLPEWQRTVDRVVDELRAMPGATAASAATFVPLGFIGPQRTDVAVEGYAPKLGESMRVAVNGVNPGYFDLMGIRIVSGRRINEDDRPGLPAAAVVNEAFVRDFLAGSLVIGRTITLAGKPPMRIVGVATDGKYDYRRMDEPSPPLVYYANRQLPSGWLTFHVRMAGDPMAAIGLTREAIRSVAPRLPLVAPTTLAEYSAIPMFPTRLGVAVLGVLGSAALILAAMGLYSVIAYGVTLRTREIGIRLALGGTARTVAMIFVGESLRLLAWGLGVGLATAFAATALVHAKVPMLPPPNVEVIAWPALILSVVAAVAGFFPARRSASIDLATTLRAE